MELKINLATASLKDAEHAIFIIGAYFGMTDLPNVVADGAFRSRSAPASDTATARQGTAQLAPNVDYTADKRGNFSEGIAGGPVGTVSAGVAMTGGAQDVELVLSGEPQAAQVFGATPPVLPPEAGASPDNSDPAAVFAGNAQPPQPVVAGATAVGGMTAPTVPGPAGTPAAPPPAPAASAPSGVEIDLDGLPWDSRINASGEGGAKPKNTDGRWRKKRGLNDATFIAKIQGELRQTLAATGQPVMPQAPAPAVAPLSPTVLPVAPSVPAPPVAPLAPAAPTADPTTFEQLMPRVTAAVMAGTLPNGALLQAVTAYAVPNIPALAHRPDLVPTIWAYLRSVYPALV